mmetsp:Transcript_10652/g.16707  ORF Transcript_10652/g.16707 Transcript_10652/m.16707 type:complete len:165 (-) Transcript_10652:1396-1890(-)
MADIHFIELAEFQHSLASSTRDKVIHIKGFASRIDLSDQNTKRLRDEMIAQISTSGVTALVFDGDSFSDESFTGVVPDIVAKANPQLLSFLLKGDEQRFEESWGSVAGGNFKITGVLVPLDPVWQGVYSPRTSWLSVERFRISWMAGVGRGFESQRATIRTPKL